MLGADPVGISGSLLGAVVPDMDLKLGLPHRTWTHWWVFYATALGILPFFAAGHNPVLIDFLHWVFIGAIFHIIEDSFTVGGVPFYAPISLGEKAFAMRGALLPGVASRFTFGVTKTGGFFEYMVLLCCIISIAYFFPDRLHQLAGGSTLADLVQKFKGLGGLW